MIGKAWALMRMGKQIENTKDYEELMIKFTAAQTPISCSINSIACFCSIC